MSSLPPLSIHSQHAFPSIFTKSTTDTPESLLDTTPNNGWDDCDSLRAIADNSSELDSDKWSLQCPTPDSDWFEYPDFARYLAEMDSTVSSPCSSLHSNDFDPSILEDESCESPLTEQHADGLFSTPNDHQAALSEQDSDGWQETCRSTTAKLGRYSSTSRRHASLSSSSNSRHYSSRHPNPSLSLAELDSDWFEGDDEASSLNISFTPIEISPPTVSSASSLDSIAAQHLADLRVSTSTYSKNKAALIQQDMLTALTIERMERRLAQPSWVAPPPPKSGFGSLAFLATGVAVCVVVLVLV